MWQLHYLVKGAAVTSTKVEDPLDLGLIYPLSAVIVIWEETTFALADTFATGTKLEVKKDGSEVIFSEEAGQVIALNHLLLPRQYQIAPLGAAGLYAAVVPFGRFIGDPEYFLDPAGWASLDLTITQPTVGAGNTIVYNVIAVRSLPKLGGSRGFFKYSNKRIYTTATSHEYITLDRKHKYAAIIAGEMDGTSTDILTELDEMKVDCDAGVFTPLDLKENNLAVINDILLKEPSDAMPGTLAVDTNYIAANWVNPWFGEDMLLDAPGFGKVVLDILSGASGGVIRVAALELVKPGEVP